VKIYLIIPASNEASAIGNLVCAARKYVPDILVIDDGSKDNTAEIAEKNGAQVIRFEHNLGKGACLIEGYRQGLKKGFDAVISMDGDGQHHPDDLPAFLIAAGDEQNALIIGNRMNNAKNMPLIRFLTNRLMSWIISLVTKQSIPDTQCGFRLVKRKLLEDINLVTSNYDMESELLIKASRRGFKIKSVPIRTIYGSEISKINPLLDTFRFIHLMARDFFRKFKHD